MKILSIVFLLVISACSSTHKKEEKKYLSSWTDNALRASIISYVKTVTTKGTTDFIPVEDRIATFDNDGTLWAEKPLVQGLFAQERANEMGLKINLDKPMTDKQLMELLVKTHTGISEEEFEMDVRDFVDNATQPKLGVPISKTLYLPQLELLEFLRDHQFTIFISSGGTIDFMRRISKKYYGVPSENVIGSNFQYSYDENLNKVMRQPKLEFMNDKAAKPVAIHKHIGKRPVFAAGNVGGEGDIEMLRFSQGSHYRSFQLLVNHDDAQREFEYKEKSGKSLDWARKYQWNVISMKRDWIKVFNQ